MTRAAAGERSRERPPGLPEILPAVDSLFARVRSGLRARWAARSVEAALATGLVGASAMLLVDRALALSPGARYAGLVALVSCAGVVLVWSLARSVATRIGPLYLASRVEALHPEFADRLISAVELASNAEPAAGSAELVYKQAEELSRGVEPRRIVAGELEWTHVHTWLLAAMALTLVMAVAMRESFALHARRCLFPWLDGREPPSAFVHVRTSTDRVRENEGFTVWAQVSGRAPSEVALLLSIPGTGRRSLRMTPSAGGARWAAEVKRVEAPGSFRLRARFGGARSDLTSDEFPFTLLEAPRVEDIRVTYSYPGYAARPPRTHEGGAVDALVGTRVVVEMTPDSPLGSARLSPPGGKAVEMSRRGRDGRERWVGGFTVRRSGSYEIALTGDAGLPGTRAYPVVVRPDSPPRASAVYDERPAREVLSRGARFNVRASDDLGLEELVLVVRREEARPGRTRREKAAGAAPRRAGPGGQASPGRVFYVPAPGFERGRREVDLGFTIPPQVMELEPGVTYRYYVRAADGRRPEPHLATSSPRTFRIDFPEAGGLLARSASRKKKRPPLLEPKARGPGRGRPRGEGPSPGSGARPPPPSRRLAGLADPPGDPGSVPPRRPSRKPERPSKLSRYASGPGLPADEADGAGKPGQKERDRDGQGPGGGKRASSRDGGKGSGGRSDRSKGGKGGAGGKPDLPGQGEYGGGGRKTAGGRPAPSGGPGTGGPGGGRTASSPGRGGPGGRSSGTPEGTPGSNRPGGAGGRNTGLPNRRPTGGGRPSGGEKGGGDTPLPETVDKKAVAGLDVRPEEVAGMRVPGDPRAPGRRKVGGIDKVSDLGRGSSRSRVGRLTGRDRLTIPKEDVPPLEILHSRPVSRAYRPLVGEYFRRLRELAERD